LFQHAVCIQYIYLLTQNLFYLDKTSEMSDNALRDDMYDWVSDYLEEYLQEGDDFEKYANFREKGAER